MRGQLWRTPLRPGLRAGFDFSLGLGMFVLLATLVGVDTSDAFPAPVILPPLTDPAALMAVVTGANISVHPAMAAFADFNTAVATAASPTRLFSLAVFGITFAAAIALNLAIVRHAARVRAREVRVGTRQN